MLNFHFYYYKYFLNKNIIFLYNTKDLLTYYTNRNVNVKIKYECKYYNYKQIIWSPCLFHKMPAKYINIYKLIGLIHDAIKIVKNEIKTKNRKKKLLWRFNSPIQLSNVFLSNKLFCNIKIIKNEEKEKSINKNEYIVQKVKNFIIPKLIISVNVNNNKNIK